jgi:hypothetical protein
VIRFLSPQWVVAFNEAVAGVDIPAPSAGDALTVGDGEFATTVIVGDGPGDRTTVTVDVCGGRISLTTGDDPAATATLRVGWDDAASFLDGAWSPTAALAGARAQVRGDLSVLKATGVVLGAVRPHLGHLRAGTDYGGEPGAAASGHDTSEARE